MVLCRAVKIFEPKNFSVNDILCTSLDGSVSSRRSITGKDDGLHNISASREISKKSELSLLHATCLLVLIFIPTKFESNPLKNKGSISL